MEIKIKAVFLRCIALLRVVVVIGIGHILLTGCRQETAVTPDPVVEQPGAGVPFLLGTTYINLASFGYMQSEYFISGKARSFKSPLPLASNGKWFVQVADQADYKTRLLVYRPTDPAKFNGTVIVEWMNVSGGSDTATEWINAHTELIRKGYAWVGVSVQKAGIDGGGVVLSGSSFPLKTSDPARYGTLVHPGDKYAYDIFSQAAKAIMHPAGINPLGDLHAQRSIAAGQSQSADFLITYYNALAPSAKLFDGYFIHSRFHGTRGLEPQEATPEGIDFLARSTVLLRDDVRAPTILLQTETDMLMFGAYQDRQPDTQYLRAWEVAGTAHADFYVGGNGFFDGGSNPNIANVVENSKPNTFVQCGLPINSGPQHFVVKSAIAALDNWLRNGVSAAYADRLEVDPATKKYVKDSVGNVLGGVRTPYVDVPIAVLSGEGQSGSLICSLFGTTKLLDKTQLASLYPDHATYVSALNNSVDGAVREGFLLSPDGDLIKAWGQASTIGNP